MRNRMLLAAAVFCTAGLLAGCAALTAKSEKIRDLEYTVVKEEDLPEELRLQIDEKKEARFKITYQSDGYLYIASGYGEQETGGYSIAMKELYLSDNAVYFDTELCGPQKGETINHAPSYPYIVVKTEAVEKPVVFQ